MFCAGAAEIIADAYQDRRFHPEIDRRTGFRTRDVLCVPLRNRDGQAIGVTQVLNKRAGAFAEADLKLAEAINRHAASALEQAFLVERLEQAQREEIELLTIAEAISTELHIDVLFTRIMAAATQLLNAERSTLFLYDAATDELWSQVAEGTGQTEIRIPAHAGIAGAAFAGGEVAGRRPTPTPTRASTATSTATSGYRTRNILAVPIIDKSGERLGVVQVLNKRGGAFTPVDIRRGQGVLRPDRDRDPECAAVLRRAVAEELQREHPEVAVERGHHARPEPEHRQDQRGRRTHPRRDGRGCHKPAPAAQVFGNRNPWVTRSLDYVRLIGASDYYADTDFALPDGSVAAINLTAAPLFESADKATGCMLVIEDITREKRVRNTMARYVAQGGRRPADRQRPGFSGRTLARRHRAVLRHPPFHDAGRGNEPAGNGNHAERLFHQHGRGRVHPRRHARQVYRRRDHGGVRHRRGPAPDADNALTVATDMIRELGRFNQLRRERGLEPIEIGIGIATGDVLAGSLGSRRRLEYTVIGDNVNLAARLEGANKHYGTTVLLAASTVDTLKSRADPAAARPDAGQGQVAADPRLRSRSITTTRERYPRLSPMITAYEAGLDCYQRRDWANAIQRFGEALEAVPTDQPSRIFIDRCRYYTDHPPPENWTGVWIMDEK